MSVVGRMISDERLAELNAGPPPRMSTGSPLPPPAWQMICEFANGYCVCAATRGEGPPCHAVEIVTQRIRNRLQHDIAAAERRKGGRHG